MWPFLFTRPLVVFVLSGPRDKSINNIFSQIRWHINPFVSRQAICSLVFTK